ncbi:MAG: hypothetical protein Pg6C_14720 [Treponemataceae bacterium]|nr:MAG: hypothetical protein Pg6C_14720 [Treponemataceae bacterium]
MRGKSSFSKTQGARLIFTLFFVSALMVLSVSVFEKVTINRDTALLTETARYHLLAAARAAALIASVEELDRYHTIEDAQTLEYQSLKNRLADFAREYNVRFVYFWRDYGGGQGQFIADNDTDPDKMVGPWSVFELEDTAREALAGEPCVTGLGSNTPPWKSLITASAPVLDSKGAVYCIAGVDIDDEKFFLQSRNTRNLLVVQITAFVIAGISGAVALRFYQTAIKQNGEGREKLYAISNNMRQVFSPYLSTDMMEEIVSDIANLNAGGTKRYMTAMFTGIQNFSHMAESMPPENLVNLLHIYLSAMSDAIFEQKGTIDKYNGDAIFAFFGAPLELSDHAFRACSSALIMKRLEKEMRDTTTSIPLFTRIGINTGEMTVGNMGTEYKANYTIMGGAANLASRLADANKLYGTWILVTETTFNETDGKIFARRLNKVRMAGIDKPVRIYEPLDFSDTVTGAMREWTDVFHEGLEQFEAHNWEDAVKLFNRVLAMNPSDGPARFFLERASRYA